MLHSDPVVVFSVLEEKFCVAKLLPDSPAPAIPESTAFFSVTRTDEEISVICEESLAPVAAEIERNWRMIKVQGPLEFALKGVLASLLRPLAEAQVGVFALSTYNTDYLLVQQYHLAKTLEVLQLAGHRITPH
jgi:hypothetical protein